MEKRRGRANLHGLRNLKSALLAEEIKTKLLGVVQALEVRFGLPIGLVLDETGDLFAEDELDETEPAGQVRVELDQPRDGAIHHEHHLLPAVVLASHARP